MRRRLRSFFGGAPAGDEQGDGEPSHDGGYAAPATYDVSLRAIPGYRGTELRLRVPTDPVVLNAQGSRVSAYTSLRAGGVTVNRGDRIAALQLTRVTRLSALDVLALLKALEARDVVITFEVGGGKAQPPQRSAVPRATGSGALGVEDDAKFGLHCRAIATCVAFIECYGSAHAVVSILDGRLRAPRKAAEKLGIADAQRGDRPMPMAGHTGAIDLSAYLPHSRGLLTALSSLLTAGERVYLEAFLPAGHEKGVAGAVGLLQVCLGVAMGSRGGLKTTSRAAFQRRSASDARPLKRLPKRLRFVAESLTARQMHIVLSVAAFCTRLLAAYGGGGGAGGHLTAAEEADDEGRKVTVEQLAEIFGTATVGSSNAELFSDLLTAYATGMLDPTATVQLLVALGLIRRLRRMITRARSSPVAGGEAAADVPTGAAEEAEPDGGDGGSARWSGVFTRPPSRSDKSSPSEVVAVAEEVAQAHVAELERCRTSAPSGAGTDAEIARVVTSCAEDVATAVAGMECGPGMSMLAHCIADQLSFDPLVPMAVMDTCVAVAHVSCCVTRLGLLHNIVASLPPLRRMVLAEFCEAVYQARDDPHAAAYKFAPVIMRAPVAAAGGDLFVEHAKGAVVVVEDMIKHAPTLFPKVLLPCSVDDTDKETARREALRSPRRVQPDGASFAAIHASCRPDTTTTTPHPRIGQAARVSTSFRNSERLGTRSVALASPLASRASDSSDSEESSDSEDEHAVVEPDAVGAEEIESGELGDDRAAAAGIVACGTASPLPLPGTARSTLARLRSTPAAAAGALPRDELLHSPSTPVAGSPRRRTRRSSMRAGRAAEQPTKSMDIMVIPETEAGGPVPLDTFLSMHSLRRESLAAVVSARPISTSVIPEGGSDAAAQPLPGGRRDGSAAGGLDTGASERLRMRARTSVTEATLGQDAGGGSAYGARVEGRGGVAAPHARSRRGGDDATPTVRASAASAVDDTGADAAPRAETSRRRSFMPIGSKGGAEAEDRRHSTAEVATPLERRNEMLRAAALYAPSKRHGSVSGRSGATRQPPRSRSRRSTDDDDD